MATYLLTWNPNNYPWDDLQNDISAITHNGYFSGDWSCGRSKRIMAGDRLFMLRQGKNPRGIFASGWAASTWFEDFHWDGTDRPALYVQMDLDVLLNPESEPILEREKLDEGILANMHWNTQISGVTIPDEVTKELEIIWSEFLLERGIKQSSVGFNTAISPDEVLDNPTYYYEGTSKQITTHVYERNPNARSECIKYHGLNCCVCGFNFETIYGSIGSNFIHVHHLKSLSEIGESYEVNPREDLRPICPNCHAMIHKRKPAFTIEEMRKLLELQRKPE